MTKLFGAMLAALAVVSTAAQAQSTSTNGSSGRMWGSAASGDSGVNSSLMHAQDGTAAGQANAAQQGLLYAGGPGMTITAVGSQSIVSTTVYGDNNTTNVSATQSSSNTGNVSNNGTIAAKTQ